MRTLLTFASVSALATLAADDAAAGGVGALRRTITISGETFDVPVPYKEGHQLNAAEASVLNQTYAENVRNNVAGKIKAAKEAWEKDAANAGSAFSIDSATVTEGEGDSATTRTLREVLAEYADSYEFGVRTARTAEPVDPVQREARSIARDMLTASIKSSGGKRKDVDDDAFEDALATLSQRNDIQKEAQRRVKQREAIGGEAIDLQALLAGGGADTDGPSSDESEGGEDE